MRIIEAVIAVLLVTGVLLVVISNGYASGQDISYKVYEAQVAVLRDIELNSDMRTAILSVVDIGEDGLGWGEFEVNGLEDVKTKIENEMPNYLICVAKICGLNDLCFLEEVQSESIYAQPVAITADLGTYDPRQLKMFCWEK